MELLLMCIAAAVMIVALSVADYLDAKAKAIPNKNNGANSLEE